MSERLLVTIPVYGQHEYTRDLMTDLVAQDVGDFDVLVIDNGGDYQPTHDEEVIRPDRNLGWAGGSNRGFRYGFGNGYSHVMTLNNDTRVSPSFIAGIIDPRLPDDVGVVAPLYDDYWEHQLSEFRGPAIEFTAGESYREVPYTDGVSLTLTRDAWQAVGDLDTQSFGRYGWGADFELCFRVTQAGLRCCVTEGSYLNHFGRRTANVVVGRLRYQWLATAGHRLGIRKTFGRTKWQELSQRPIRRFDLNTHRPLEV